MFLESVPDTSGYMLLGYAVAFIVMGLYILSMYIRSRNLQRDLETFQSIESEQTKKK